MADIIDGLFMKCLSVYCLWSITVNIWGKLRTQPIVAHLSSMYSVSPFCAHISSTTRGTVLVSECVERQCCVEGHRYLRDYI